MPHRTTAHTQRPPSSQSASPHETGAGRSPRQRRPKDTTPTRRGAESTGTDLQMLNKPPSDAPVRGGGRGSRCEVEGRCSIDKGHCAQGEGRGSQGGGRGGHGEGRGSQGDRRGSRGRGHGSRGREQRNDYDRNQSDNMIGSDRSNETASSNNTQISSQPYGRGSGGRNRNPNRGRPARGRPKERAGQPQNLTGAENTPKPSDATQTASGSQT